MTRQAEYVWTQAHKRALGAMLDLSKGTIRFLLFIADFGQGKTAFLNKVMEKLLWRLPLDHYVERIRRTKEGFGHDFHLHEVVNLAEEFGLFDATDDEAFEATEVWLQAAFPCLRPDTLPGATVHHLLRELARRNGRTMPDPLRLLSLYGITETPTARHPVLITGTGSDRPGTLTLKIVRAIEGPDRNPKYRFFYLRDLLREVPVFVLVDESDMLSVDCLHELRQTFEESGTPYCLAGSKRLVARLQTSPVLRALLTRVEAQVTLDGATASDLRAVCPDLPNEILLAVWAASGRNFRVALLMVQTLRQLKHAYPERRLTKRAVTFAAGQVLAANPERVPLDDAIEDGITDARVEARKRIPAVTAQAEPVRRAAQAGK